MNGDEQNLDNQSDIQSIRSGNAINDDNDNRRDSLISNDFVNVNIDKNNEERGNNIGNNIEERNNNEEVLIVGEEKQSNICTRYWKKAWENKCGKVVICITGGLVALTLLYAGIAGIVSASTEVSKNEKVHVLPFNNISMGVYNKDVDDRLRFLTATVAMELRNMCDKDKPISWEAMQSVLSQCSVLEKYDTDLHVIDTFADDFSDTTHVKSWLYTLLKTKDMDVFNAARIHDTDINEVIDFVKNSSTHNWMADHVSNSYDLLDIGMIRFPTKTEPYVKLYRLQLSGLFSGSSFMMASRNINRSLSADVYSCKYHPRDDLLKLLAPDMVKNTLIKFEHMLK